jgi:predicted CopG family antitoxin
VLSIESHLGGSSPPSTANFINMGPMLFPLLLNHMSSSYSDYVVNKTNQETEDMTHRPTVTVSYDEYHELQDELKKLREMKSKNSVYGYAYARKRDCSELFHVNFEGMKASKAIDELQEAVRVLRVEMMSLSCSLSEAEEEIEYLKSRSLLERIFNK